MAQRELSILVKALGAAKAARDIGKVEKSVKGVGVRTIAAGTAIGGMADQLAAFGIRKIASGIQGGIESLAELEDATTRVDGAIATLGLNGQITSQQIAGWANDIERDTEAAFDDKAITASTETLLRYGKIAPKNVRPAMEVMTDLAARTGSVESASSLLAKALADPAKASGKLARAGVILTKEQQKQIKAMVEAGDTAGAQSLLLQELAKTTEGAAKASAGPYRDSMNILADVTEDAQRALGEGFMPVITEVRDILTDELSKPSTIQAIKDFGKSLAGGLHGLIDIARGLPWDTIGASLKTAGTGAKAVLDAFLGLPSWVQGAVLTGWGLNKLSGGLLGGFVGELGKGLIKGVLGMTAGVVNAKAGVVNVAGGAGAGAAPGAPGGGGIANAIGSGAALAVVIEGVREGVNLFGNLGGVLEAGKTGDSTAVLTNLKQAMDQTILVPQIIRDIGKGIIAQIEGSLPKTPIPVVPQGMSPDERQAVNDQRAKTEKAMSKTDRLRERIEANRIATVTKGNGIISAIRGLRMNVNLTIPVTLNASQKRSVLRVKAGSNLYNGVSYDRGVGQLE